MSAPILQAFFECNDELQAHAKKLIKTIVDKKTDDDDRFLAVATLHEILFPYLDETDNLLGMNLDDSNPHPNQQGSGSSNPFAEDHEDTAAESETMRKEEASFAEKLGQLMALKGLTQSELASILGIGQSAIAMMLKRECRPQKRTIHRLAQALGVSPSELW
ncbi:MAG: helix-turn-helix transcriptional regulator [Gemmataceae bacterium]